jgi:hypothetical protein
MAYRKPFNRQTYDECDPRAKAGLLKIYEREGHAIVNEKETMGPDLVTEKGGITYYSEGEIKLSWKTDDWNSSWKDVRIPGRKKRLVDNYENLTFYVFNKAATRCWKIESKSLSDTMLQTPDEWWNKNKEEFYVVPVEKATLMEV